jgi:hypothetical protein
MRAALVLALVGAALASGGCLNGPEPGRAAPVRHYAIRGIIDHDSSPSGFDDQAAIGFNTIDSGPYVEKLDRAAARGVRAIIWLGGYSNERCRFVESDAWVRSHLKKIAGHPAIAAYFIDDEPDAWKCPGAPDQIRSRSELVKSLDPGATTFMSSFRPSQLRLFAGSVDAIALTHYACSRSHGCDYALIDDQAAAADRAGIRYWGVIQAFGDDWYRLPTPDELHDQFLYWKATNMSGYLVFSWRWPRDDPKQWLGNHPELQAQLAKENAAAR